MNDLDLARLVHTGATIHVEATGGDGQPLLSADATVVAVYSPDRRPVLVAVTADRQEVRLPVDMSGARAAGDAQPRRLRPVPGGAA